METYKILLLIANAVAIGLLVDLFRQLQIKIKTKYKLLFWRMLTSFLILITGRCLADLLNMLPEHAGYLFRMTITFVFTLWAIRYGHKTYISNEWGNFVGTEVEDASFFDIEKFIDQIKAAGVIEFSGMRIDFISEKDGKFFLRVECLTDVRFPWQFHYGHESFLIERQFYDY